jgi:multidrug transporter EmrE-like cation transporter
MTGLTFSLVITAIVANVLASILLKKAAMHSVEDALALPPKMLALGSLALLFYAIAFAVYALVLRSMPVSKAYTLITFGAQAGLIFAGAIIFGERYGSMAWIGLAMVCCGLVLVARSIVA